MTVYLAWLNDLLLGVFNARAKADNRVEAEKRRYPGEDWEQLPSGRWRSRLIARLEVEECEVE